MNKVDAIAYMKRFGFKVAKEDIPRKDRQYPFLELRAKLHPPTMTGAEYFEKNRKSYVSSISIGFKFHPSEFSLDEILENIEQVIIERIAIDDRFATGEIQRPIPIYLTDDAWLPVVTKLVDKYQ